MIVTLHVHTLFYIPLTLCPHPPPRARAGDPHEDSVIMTIIITCAVLFFLITLMVMRHYFLHKNVTVKTDVPVVPS